MVPELSELDHLFSVTYEELRRLASRVRDGDRSPTMNTTALVNEAYLKLAASRGFAVESRLHFKRVAARAMRQVLVEAARRRTSAKRGGDQIHVTFDDGLDAGADTSREVLLLDAALEDLARLEPRQAQIVECRFFGGLDIAETAKLLDVSDATVSRDWRAAKAWLASELRVAR